MAKNNDDYSLEESAVVEDLSHSELDAFPDFILVRAAEITKLLLDHNWILVLPRCVGAFSNLISLDIGSNNMTYISSEISNLKQLRSLNARNNNMNEESLPKELSSLRSLQEVNLSGNNFADFPMQLVELVELKTLHLGGNQIKSVPKEIVKLQKLEMLYLGGNKLVEMPVETGFLPRLNCLVLCDNLLVSLPNSLSNLRQLRSLSLHNNRLSTLPPEIISLNLIELSLRNNPLIHKFVQDMTYEAPSLLELAGRVIKIKSLPYSHEELPRNLIQYLDQGKSCVNPKCKGVYFTSRVEHIKFVDFCGKYRIPLLEYLCSPNCRVSPAVLSSSDSESDEEMPMTSKMKKVLLG